MISLGGGWDELLSGLFEDERYKKIREFLKYEYSHNIVYPDMYDLFNCFKYTPLNNLKAVILGQDPYHEPDQAHGLCFSVKKGVPLPPSLQRLPDTEHPLSENHSLSPYSIPPAQGSRFHSCCNIVLFPL